MPLPGVNDVEVLQDGGEMKWRDDAGEVRVRDKG